jgi:serine/threonine-protein kinase RsbW
LPLKLPPPPPICADMHFRVIFDSQLEPISQLATMVRSACDQVGLCDLDALELALVEALTNAVEHAYHLSAGNDIELSLALDDEELTIEIAEYGQPMAPGTLESAATEPSHDDDDDLDLDLPTRGYGLGILQRAMHEVRYASAEGRNALTLVRRRRAP